MSDTPPPRPADLPASWQEEHDDAIRTDRKSRRWWVIGGIVAAIVAVIGIVVFVQALQPEDRAWPEQYGGRPAGLGGERMTAADVEVTAPPGVYIWQSFDGWHLWIVNGDDVAGLSGTIRSNDDIVNATSSAPDAGTVDTQGRTITFDLDAGAVVAGVDFDPGFADQLTFELSDADGPVAADQVRTGSDSTPVEAVPVVVDKAVVD